MRRYDYTLGATVNDISNEPFSGYSIVDGGLISYSGETIIYDECDVDVSVCEAK